MVSFKAIYLIVEHRVGRLDFKIFVRTLNISSRVQSIQYSNK